MSGQSVRLRRRSLALIGFAIVALAAVAGSYVYLQALARERIALNAALDAHAAQLARHLEARVAIVAAAAAAFEPDPFSATALKVVDYRMIETIPDIFSFVWVVATDVAGAPRVVDALRASGHPDPGIFGPGRVRVPQEALQEPIAIVLDIRPASPMNQRSLGVNTAMMDGPRLAQARARATRNAAATGPLELVQLPGENAVIIYAPVYRGEGESDRDLLGYIGMSFRYHALIAAAFANGPPPPFGFAVHDADDPQARLLFSAGAEVDAPLQRTVNFAGRTLVLSFAAPAPEAAARLSAAIAVALTLALGTLIMGGAFALSLAHRRTEFALARQTGVEARLRVVVDELNHRVRNMLTIVQALIRFSFRDGADGPARAMLMERLSALGRATTLLADGDWSGVSIKELLRASPIADSRGVASDGPDLRLTPAAAQNLGLLIHELWTNATKHGALAGDHGRVELTWAAEADRFTLTWAEHDGPPREAAPLGRGFGRQLIETIAPAAVHGAAELSFGPDGFRYRLEAPLASVAQTDPAKPSLTRRGDGAIRRG